MKKSDQTVLLFKKPIFSRSKDSLLKWLSSEVIRIKKPLIILTPNPEQLVLAQKNPGFDRLLKQADVLIPDGIGLVWASRILSWFGRGSLISERITGIDLATDFLEWAAQRDWTVLLLGGKGYHQARNQHIELPMSGSGAGKLKLQWLEGYQNAGSPTEAEERVVTAAIRKIKPQLVFVAFGAPRQEQWIADHLKLLNTAETKIVMAVGGSFDVLLGKLKRSPWWMRALGLEWLYRLIQEPHRWRRQLALIEFSWMTFQAALTGKNLPK